MKGKKAKIHRTRKYLTLRERVMMEMGRDPRILPSLQLTNVPQHEDSKEDESGEEVEPKEDELEEHLLKPEMSQTNSKEKKSELLSATIAILTDQGMVDHFESTGQDSTRHTRRCAVLLIWASKNINTCELEPNEEKVFELFKQFLNKDYKYLQRFSVYLLFKVC